MKSNRLILFLVIYCLRRKAILEENQSTGVCKIVCKFYWSVQNSVQISVQVGGNLFIMR